ncbi:MAG: hypothetical protein PUC65_13995 [Clostridiales bacterium]|nr:hypothetical protein [Clostridiales bacterium]
MIILKDNATKQYILYSLNDHKKVSDDVFIDVKRMEDGSFVCFTSKEQSFYTAEGKLIVTTPYGLESEGFLVEDHVVVLNETEMTIYDYNGQVKHHQSFSYPLIASGFTYCPIELNYQYFCLPEEDGFTVYLKDSKYKVLSKNYLGMNMPTYYYPAYQGNPYSVVDAYVVEYYEEMDGEIEKLQSISGKATFGRSSQILRFDKRYRVRTWENEEHTDAIYNREGKKIYKSSKNESIMSFGDAKEFYVVVNSGHIYRLRDQNGNEIFSIWRKLQDSCQEALFVK